MYRYEELNILIQRKKASIVSYRDRKKDGKLMVSGFQGLKRMLNKSTGSAF
jgi:hypothetical protein